MDRLGAPLCVVQAPTLGQMSGSLEALQSMWRVFSKCANAVAEGERYENLTWRVWSRQAMCREPSLSTPQTSNLNLARMIATIQDRRNPIEPLAPAIVNAMPPDPAIRSFSESSVQSCASTTALSSSDTHTAASAASTQSSFAAAPEPAAPSHSVIRGFHPSQPSSSYQLSCSPSTLSSTMRDKGYDDATPLASTPAAAKKTKQGIFMLGGSSGDDESSFEERVQVSRPSSCAKHTSFRDELKSRMKAHEDEDVFVSDDDESVDDEDWEDEGSEAGEVLPDKPLFKRVDSRANLSSRRSLLTTMMHEPDRQSAFANLAQQQSPLRKSRTQSGLGPHVRIADVDALPEPEFAVQSRPVPTVPLRPSRPVPTQSFSGMPAIPIVLSPRTTRRHMLATEMTESLRKAVLFERQEKKTLANAAIRRRHTTQDLVKMQNSKPTDDSASTDYHQSGW